MNQVQQVFALQAANTGTTFVDISGLVVVGELRQMTAPPTVVSQSSGAVDIVSIGRQQFRIEWTIPLLKSHDDVAQLELLVQFDENSQPALQFEADVAAVDACCLFAANSPFCANAALDEANSVVEVTNDD